MEMDSIIRYASAQSVMRDSVDWSRISLALDSIFAKDGLIPATQHLLRELRDFHGKVWVDNTPYYGLTKPWTPTSMKIDTVLLQRFFRNQIPIHSARLKKRIGYIQVPGLAFGPQDSMHARIIRESMKSVVRKGKVRGWIVDLRLNGGGTMFPMLAGLEALLGNETELGSFRHKDTGYKDPWRLRQGEVYIGETQITDYDLQKKLGPALLMDHLPVAVLISAATASSGEVTAIAFKNRPLTRFFGEDTAGYTTTVSWQPISERVVLQLTTSYYADRHDQVFQGIPVPPDEYTAGGEDFEQIAKDRTVLRAIAWLRTQRGQRD